MVSLFFKIVDLYFFIPASAIEQFPFKIHEGLTIGLYFPLLRNSLCDWKIFPFICKLESKFSELYSSDTVRDGNIMCQFWESYAWVASMTLRMVRALLSSAT